MSNNITIEMVDAVLERMPEATYAQAKEALLANDCNVLDAIIYLEEQQNSCRSKKTKEAIDEAKESAKETIEEVFGKDGEKIKCQLKDLMKKSSVVRVIIDKNGKAIMNIPLTVGAVGLAFVPMATLVGLSAAVVTKYSIKIQNEEDGETVDLGELNEEKLKVLKEMIVNAAKGVKDVVVEKKDEDKDITDDLMNEFEKNKNESCESEDNKMCEDNSELKNSDEDKKPE